MTPWSLRNPSRGSWLQTSWDQEWCRGQLCLYHVPPLSSGPMYLMYPTPGRWMDHDRRMTCPLTGSCLYIVVLVVIYLAHNRCHLAHRCCFQWNAEPDWRGCWVCSLQLFQDSKPLGHPGFSFQIICSAQFNDISHLRVGGGCCFSLSEELPMKIAYRIVSHQP